MVVILCTSSSVLVEISLGNGSMSCSTHRESIFVNHEIRGVACVYRPQGLISYAYVEEGSRDHLGVEGEVLSTHHRWHHPEICRAKQINGYLPHMLIHSFIVHCWGINGVLFLKEVHCC